MEQVPIAPEDIRDPFELRVPGQGLGRDGARTPMQWDDGRYAGFSDAKPWLPLAANAVVDNVAQQQAQPDSIYHLYCKLIALRKAHTALQLGTYWQVVARGDLLLYVREQHDERIFVALNLGGEPTVATFPKDAISGTLLLSTYGDRENERVSGDLALRAHEGILVALSS
jgi:alpha-glucosidase